MNPPYKHEEVAGDYTTHLVQTLGNIEGGPARGTSGFETASVRETLPTALPQAYLHKSLQWPSVRKHQFWRLGSCRENGDYYALACKLA